MCSANTLYFWPEPEENIREISRVLKENGRLVLGFRTSEQLQDLTFTKHGFTLYTADEVVKLLEKSGFSNVSIVTSPYKTMDSYCAVATKM